MCMEYICQGGKSAGRSEFFVRAEPECSEGGLSEDVKNREGVASGSATLKTMLDFYFNQKSISRVINRKIVSNDL